MVTLDLDQYLELEKIALGAFAPLSGFMGEEEFWSCARSGRLSDGSVFPIPILLDMSAEDRARIRGKAAVALSFRGVPVGRLHPTGVFRPDRPAAARLIFGTDDPRHPGVSHVYGLAEYLVGGGGRTSRARRARGFVLLEKSNGDAGKFFDAWVAGRGGASNPERA